MYQNPENIDYETLTEDIKLLGFRFPVARIAESTGFTKGNVSRFISGDLKPSSNFLKTFYSIYSNEIKKAKSKQEKENEFLVDATAKISINDYINALNELNESRKSEIKKEEEKNRILEEFNAFLKNAFNSVQPLVDHSKEKKSSQTIQQAREWYVERMKIDQQKDAAAKLGNELLLKQQEAIADRKKKKEGSHGKGR